MVVGWEVELLLGVEEVRVRVVLLVVVAVRSPIVLDERAVEEKDFVTVADCEVRETESEIDVEVADSAVVDQSVEVTAPAVVVDRIKSPASATADSHPFDPRCETLSRHPPWGTVKTTPNVPELDTTPRAIRA